MSDEPEFKMRWELRAEVERIIDSYTLCMVGGNTEPYIAACADDVLARVLGWAVRYSAPPTDTAEETNR